MILTESSLRNRNIGLKRFKELKFIETLSDNVLYSSAVKNFKHLQNRGLKFYLFLEFVEAE